LVEYLKIREDSCGAGMNRGGCGTSFMIKLLEGEATGFILGDRVDHQPQGFFGGLSATPTKLLIPATVKTNMPFGLKLIHLSQGDGIECNSLVEAAIVLYSSKTLSVGWLVRKLLGMPMEQIKTTSGTREK
jgi:N-methylhydantoinase B/oxoprolinase/acetone carboxylase alpha subunit